MPINLTMNDIARKGAEYYLSRQGISDDRKNQIMPATKYNLLTWGFNGGSCLLVAASVNAIFFAMTTAFVLGTIGLFLKYVTGKEHDEYTLPDYRPERQQPLAQEDARTQAQLRSILSEVPEPDKAANVFRNVGLVQPQQWNRNEISFFGFDFWRNTIEIPQAIEQRAAR